MDGNWVNFNWDYRLSDSVILSFPTLALPFKAVEIASHYLFN